MNMNLYSSIVIFKKIETPFILYVGLDFSFCFFAIIISILRELLHPAKLC